MTNDPGPFEPGAGRPSVADAAAVPVGAGAAARAPSAPRSHPPRPRPPRAGAAATADGPRRSGSIGVLVLILVGLVGYFLSAIGPAASIIGMLLALVPLAAVLLAVRLIDRWEPEPRGLLVFAVAWGAIAAVGDRPGRRPADHDGLRRGRLAHARGVRRGRAGADRRGVRQGPRRLPDLRHRATRLRRARRRGRLRRR